MTAKKLPLDEVSKALDFLEARGLPIDRCAIDIRFDGVKVSPPANTNPRESLASYLDRPPHRAKADKGR
jgi:hypothetical protein